MAAGVFDGMAIAAVSFEAEWIEISFIELDATSSLVQEIRTIRARREMFDDGELENVLESLTDLVTQSLIRKRNPPDSFTAPR